MTPQDRAVVDELVEACKRGASAADVNALAWRVFGLCAAGRDLEELAANRLALLTTVLLLNLEDALPVLAAAAAGEPHPPEELDELSGLYGDWVQAHAELAEIRGSAAC